MNNLKKVLALGLALVMLLGMFTIVSAADGAKVATDLTDWDSITHQSAVALNVDLGIIEGMPDGSYSPAANIDRASWAKLAYVAANGDDDADAYLGTVSALKDVSGNWAESYINFLYANKYISGDNFGNYNPSNNVTVVEACKVMLTILGYDSKNRGYENDPAWSGKIMSDAKAAGLMKNVDQSAMQALTRDNAAQIIYNALQARYREAVMLQDNGSQYVASYSQHATLGYKVFGIVKLTGVVTQVATDGTLSAVQAWNADSEKATISSAGKITNGVVKASLSDVGQLCDVFVKADATYDDVNGWFTSVNVTDIVSTTVARSDIEPLKTITDETFFDTRSSDIWNKVNDLYVGVECDKDENGNPAVTFYVNGEPKPARDLAKGEVAKLYDTDNTGKVDTITILAYKVAKITGNVRTTTEKNVEKVIIPGVTGGYVPTSQITGSWADLQKDDVVLYYTNGQTGDKMVIGIEPAESVTGKVTSVSSKGELTVNGKTYDCTGIEAKHVESQMKTWGDYDNEYTFYLDKNGGICYDVQNTDESVTSNVAVILQSSWITSGAIDANEYLEAKLLFMDGTAEVVRVSKIGVGSPNPTLKTIVADADFRTDRANRQIKISDVADMMSGTNANGDKTFSYKDGFFSYHVDSNGYYELTNLSLRINDYGQVHSVSTTNADGIVKRPTFDGVNSANSRTVFVVERDNGDTITYGSYTGHTNVPAVSKNNIVGGVVIHEINDDTGAEVGAAKFVYIKASAFADDVPEGFIFIRSNNYTVDVDGNYTASVVDAKGEETTMVFTSSAWASVEAVENYENRLFAIDTVNEGVIEEISQVAEDMYGNGVVHKGTFVDYGDGVVVTDQGAYDVDDKTVVVLIDMKEDTENNRAGRLGYQGVTLLGPNDTVDIDSNVYDADNVQVAVIEDEELCDYVYIIRGVLLKQNQE